VREKGIIIFDLLEYRGGGRRRGDLSRIKLKWENLLGDECDNSGEDAQIKWE
jgi:hypothetical protein